MLVHCLALAELLPDATALSVIKLKPLRALLLIALNRSLEEQRSLTQATIVIH